ncbi:MAG: hypothetical protein LC799_21875 [Actinobacteria bacterium]|nr:hypothetical protein [Actinomycetota bacterium]
MDTGHRQYREHGAHADPDSRPAPVDPARHQRCTDRGDGQQYRHAPLQEEVGGRHALRPLLFRSVDHQQGQGPGTEQRRPEGQPGPVERRACRQREHQPAGRRKQGGEAQAVGVVQLGEMDASFAVERETLRPGIGSALPERRK